MEFFGSPLLLAAGGAFAVGVTGSLHCLVMCGPLACAAAPLSSGWRGRGAYQVGRVVAYALVGAVLGGFGKGVLGAFSVSVQPYLPWIMAAALVASALELGKKLPPIPGLSRLSRAVVRSGAKFSPMTRAGAIGAATPLLPCGLLYGVYAGAIATQSISGGALVLFAFALGGLPALLAAQFQMEFFRKSAIGGPLMKRVVPIAAAIVIVARAVMVEPGGEPKCH